MGLNIENERKVKVAIIGPHGKILTGRRSQEEHTRKGEYDWFGGSFNPRESNLMRVARREVTIEEIPGIELAHPRALHVKAVVVDGGFKTSYLIAAAAKNLPEEALMLEAQNPPDDQEPDNFPGIVIPPGIISMGDEHDLIGWVAPVNYNKNFLIPKKYRMAANIGRKGPIFRELVQLYQTDGSLLSLPQAMPTAQLAAPQPEVI